jgi:hypothetical protein
MAQTTQVALVASHALRRLVGLAHQVFYLQARVDACAGLGIETPDSAEPL